MPDGDDADTLINDLKEELRVKEREVAHLQTALDEARMTGIAVGVLLARTPGWTEQDALAAWDAACERLTRGGNTKALASYVMQTGSLPDESVPATV